MDSYHILFVLLLFLDITTGAPVDGSAACDIFTQTVVKTTTNSDGSVLDWFPLHAQVSGGRIASPPPLPLVTPFASNRSDGQPWGILQTYDADRGPEGTVPILRQEVSLLDQNTTLQMQQLKYPPVDPEHIAEAGIAAAAPHWYASSAQRVQNRGGSASYSTFKAWTETNHDFSLLQTAVIRNNVPKPGDNSKLVRQTVEAGWINYPRQGSEPHLFVFYTTNGYAEPGHNKGGWNRDVAGWVQVDSQIYPGTSFAPLSTRGGPQYDIKIQWFLSNGNWWLFVVDRWIGYYPGSLFSAGTDASRSLQSGSDQIHYYGEVTDSNPQPKLTRTDMGSGAWPEAGFQQSAYIRNMVYTDMNGRDQRYDGTWGASVSDSNRYRMKADFQSQTTWGSHMYLGGPGAGGVVNG